MTSTEHVLTPDDRCPCGQPQDASSSGYCSYECYSKYDLGAPIEPATPAPMGEPQGEAEHGIDVDWGYEALRCKCGAAFVENDTEALSLHLQDVARAESALQVRGLEGQLATARRLLDEQRGATRVAAGAADRFRDVLSEGLGHPDENPGDDVLVAELREHFGFSGPEPTRWRDFLTGARAQIDQIEADHAALGLDGGGPDA